MRLKEPSERLSKREESKLVISNKLLKELEEAMENTRRIQETQREESKSVMVKALPMRLAREAPETEDVRSAASKISDAERAKSEVVRGKDSESSEVSPSSSVGPSTPEKSRSLIAAEISARQRSSDVWEASTLYIG